MPKRVSKKALKVEDYKLRDYELMLVIRPEIADEALDATIDNVGHFITERGGSISEVERWGRRKLAYPVKHCAEGNYVVSRFKLKPTVSKELEANLQISEEVLRHLLVRTK